MQPLVFNLVPALGALSYKATEYQSTRYKNLRHARAAAKAQPLLFDSGKKSVHVFDYV